MNILGLSFYYHDSSAALVQDGKLVAAAEEERFSRVKHDSGFPMLAIEFVCKMGGITVNDVDYIVFYEKPFVKFERMLLSAMATFPRSAAVFRESMQRWVTDKLWIKSMMSKKLGIPSSKILFCDHHMSHAACSFYTSPFKDAAILTVDGAGEWSTVRALHVATHYNTLAWIVLDEVGAELDRRLIGHVKRADQSRDRRAGVVAIVFKID